MSLPRNNVRQDVPHGTSCCGSCVDSACVPAGMRVVPTHRPRRRYVCLVAFVSTCRFESLNPTLIAHSLNETGAHFVNRSASEMQLDFVCILLSEIGTDLRTEHSGFESSAQTLQSSLCF